MQFVHLSEGTFSVHNSGAKAQYLPQSPCFPLYPYFVAVSQVVTVLQF